MTALVDVPSAGVHRGSRLGHGAFYGDYREQRLVGPLALAEMRPTVPEHDVQTHTHDDAHFLLLLEGKYLSTARGMPEVCTTRALVLNPPGTTHRDCFRGLDGRFFTLSIPAGAWRAATEYRTLTQDAMRLPATALVLATRLWHELRNWDGASPLAIEAGLQLLLDAVAQQSPRERDGPMWLERAREQLHDEWRRTPDLAELADTAGVHPVYLARAFRRRYGCSPGEYLRRCRMERAIALLHDRSKALADIAAACGFVDQSHFTHAFRRQHRCTPAQYRALG
ncbi:AraC family transcriptional regulator [Lysobacter sp. P5_B9]